MLWGSATTGTFQISPVSCENPRAPTAIDAFPTTRTIPPTSCGLPTDSSNGSNSERNLLSRSIAPIVHLASTGLRNGFPCMTCI